MLIYSLSQQVFRDGLFNFVKKYTMKNIQRVQHEVSTYQHQLQKHQLYEQLASVDDIKVFMENHVFAVWDFMSLLKKLQQMLTCVSTPWIPSENATLSRFINEIVHGEESDVDMNGIAKSHFEMYHDAMQQIGADTSLIDAFLDRIKEGEHIETALSHIDIDDRIADFVRFTFSVIESDQPHQIAAVFTFGREDVIPDMFMEILNNSDKENAGYDQLIYYLNRHIELDDDEHGPLSLKMVAELCENDDKKWEDVKRISKKALEKRIMLWDAISDLIKTNTSIADLSHQ